MNFADVEAVYNKWLYLADDPDLVLVTYASVVSNRLDSKPLWIFLVGASSCGKSVFLNSLHNATEVKVINQISNRTLISAFRTKGGEDPSLLPKLDKKVLVIRDFAPVLEMHHAQRDEVFSQLRDAYDGEVIRATGVGEMSIKARFGLIAGCTKILEHYRTMTASLGERFLTYKTTIRECKEFRDKASETVGYEAEMEHELQTVAKEYLDESLKLPRDYMVPDDEKKRIKRAAVVLCRLRTPCQRDGMSKEIDFPLEVTELSARIIKQVEPLYFTAKFMTRSAERATKLVKRIFQCSAPYVRVRTIEEIFKQPDITINELATKVKMSPIVVRRVVDELQLLNLLENRHINPKVAKYVNDFFDFEDPLSAHPVLT